MKKIWKRFFFLIANLSLKRKLVFTVTFSIVLLSASGLAGQKLISETSLALLRETVASSLSFSTSVISDCLADVEAMSAGILADSVIQENLAILYDSDSPREQTYAHQALSYAVSDYYDRFKSSCINYIALYYPQNVIYSDFLSGTGTPEQIEAALLSCASQKEGRPVWLYEAAGSQSGESCFYLSRQIRDIQSPDFRSLGTVIVSVNIDELLASLSERQGFFPDTRYFIAHSKKIVCSSDETAPEIYGRMKKPADGRYEILSADGHKYFVYSTLIPGHALTYTCYLTYDSVFRSATLAAAISLAILLITGLTAFLFSHLAIGSISRHTRHLIERMQAYNAENPPALEQDAPYRNRNDEFGLLNRQFDRMARHIHRLIQDNYVNELWKKDAQLKALEKQIQPHFLYNTLESINWRAKACGNSDISRMTESLGSLLRASLTRDNGEWSLQKELEITEAYITIQKYRFEEQLEYSSRCDARLAAAQIPKFMIQPLVENAVHYGLEENVDVCRIEVTVCLDASESLLHIYVKNNGSQFEDNLLARLRSSGGAARGLGIGLVNIDERIKLMFGPSYGLMLYNRREDAIARITIPYFRLCSQCKGD